MADRIQLKRSDVPGRVPVSGDLAVGELAVNTADARLFAKKGDGSIVDLGILATERTKLAGIQAGATANATDAQLRDRATHTGSQAISTITGLSAAISAASGLAQGGSTQDPNGAVNQVILSNHANTPNGILGTSVYWHITTTFYSTISATGNRSQIAVQYNGGNQCFARSCFSNVWTGWIRLDNSQLVKVASTTDTTADRLLTTDYLDIGKLDKTFWPKATSLLTLKNGPDRTVWVEPDTVDAPHSGFYGKVTCQRRSSTTVIMEAKSLFEAARYIYTFTPLGDSGWVKETMHEVGEWVDLRPYLLSPFFWKTARDGNNHFPQIRLVDRNTVELRGVVSFNATSAAPPTGAVAFRVPEGFRPQMTSGGLCMADSASPFWFGSTGYLVQGQVNYNGNPAWENGNVQMLLIGAPNPVADGAVELSGIRYHLS